MQPIRVKNIHIRSLLRRKIKAINPNIRACLKPTRTNATKRAYIFTIENLDTKQ
jgi:hypothetical protein